MTKYIDAERLKAEIEKSTPDRLQLLVYRDIILSLIDSLQQEQQEELDKSLEEAAGDFVWEVMEEDYDGPSELSKKLRPSSKISDYYNALAEFFKAGAKWGIEHAKK